MAWLLTVLLFFFIILLVGHIISKKIKPHLAEKIEKNEMDRKAMFLEHQINVKEHQKRVLERTTGRHAEIKDLDDEIFELKELHKQIKKGDR